MKKIRVVISILLGLTVLGTAVPAFAQTTPDVSGSKKTGDFQGTNNDIQNNNSSGLQTTNSLQTDTSQTGLSQSSLSGKTDLQVAGTTGDPNRNTTTAGAEKVRYPRNPLPYVVIGLLMLAGILYTVLDSDDKDKSTAEASKAKAADVKPEVVVAKPKKTKKSSTPPAKRTGKKKSNAKKRKK